MTLKKDLFKEKLILITYGVVLFVLLINYEWLIKGIGFLGNVFLPFIIGLFVALILNVFVSMFENKLLSKLKRGKRQISVILSVALVFGIVAFLVTILVPQIKNAGKIFIENLPKYQKNIVDIGKKLELSNKQLKILEFENTSFPQEIKKFISNNSNRIIDFSMGLATSVLSLTCNIFIGIVFAIYLLLDKEKIVNQFNKLLKALGSEKVYNRIVEVVKLSNVTFGNFIRVQMLEAFILGFLCFIGMLLFRLPYAATISVLVGVTALLPVFGAFIGCIIGAFLIFMISPLKAATFIIFFVVLQQIEGNLIYPKVVGRKIGLPSIWVLLAVTVGASLGGIIGMFISVPVVSVIYSLLKIFVNKKVN